MRLEGATAEEWKAEAETQNFRLLAETTTSSSADGEGNPFERSLEDDSPEQMASTSCCQAAPRRPNRKQGLC
jgi:hypothetical protein